MLCVGFKDQMLTVEARSFSVGQKDLLATNCRRMSLELRLELRKRERCKKRGLRTTYNYKLGENESHQKETRKKAMPERVGSTVAVDKRP